MELCLKQDAKLSHIDAENNDAVHLAMKQNERKALKFLLNAGLRSVHRKDGFFPIT